MGESSYANIRDQINGLSGLPIMELSSSDITHQIDDFHGVEIYDPIPISNESHAVELLESQFQELFSATTGLTQPSKRATKDRGSTSSSSSQSQSQLFCKICMENVLADEVFQTSNVCSHVFCRDCLTRYLRTKIRENISIVKCPDENCKVVLEQECAKNYFLLRFLKDAQKFYCPFKDCSELMMDDGEEIVTSSECPSCRRLFCAACKVVWHSGLSFCEGFGKLGEDERAK